MLNSTWFENLKIPASCLALDADMNLWMGDNDGNISLYNPEKANTTKVRIVNKSIPANSRSVSKIYPINNNELLIGCFRQGLKSYSTQTGKVRSLSLRTDKSDIYVRDIAIDNDGQYPLVYR